MTSPADQHTMGPGELLRLTVTKAVGNTALRWIPLFLFVLEDAFEATTTQLTLVLGLGEMTGLGTLLIGDQLDRGRERTFLIAAMILLSGSGIIALGGTLTTFAISFVLVIGAASLNTVSGHTWLSRRVPFERRGRAIGIFEMSWALALLVGAPIVALIIDVFGWRGPFVLFSIAGALMAVVIAQLPDGRAGVHVDPGDAGDLQPSASAMSARRRRLPLPAVLAVGMSASIATAGLATIVIVGTWLEGTFAISTGEIGVTAMLFGLAEIIASGASARLSDQLGKARTTAISMLAVVIGLVIMMSAGTNFVAAVVGLAIFFIGFEYSIVTSFSIVSESAPLTRGRALAANNAIGTLARGAGTIASGFLFEAYGISGPAILSICAAGLALILLGAGQRTEAGGA